MKKLYGAVLAFLLAFALTVTPASASNFKDIPTNHSLKIEIDYLVQQGVIGGYQDGTFKPNLFIQKKHIAKMMAKALDLPKNNLKHPNYKDVSRNHPYYEDIAALYTAGIFSDAPYFKPDSYISRAFMAKILAEAFDLKSIAQNSVTYKDVNQSNPFYRYIQLVSMNQVATGYTHGYNDMSFQPNKILTRAHFSAFLARAMTLTQGNYTPNTEYNYYYTNHSPNILFPYPNNVLFTFDRDESVGVSIETFWKARNQDTRDIIEYSYNINPQHNLWYMAPVNTDSGPNTKYPFTIGMKIDTLNSKLPAFSSDLDFKFRKKQEILKTNETVVIGNQKYSNVVVLKHTYRYGSSIVYIAPDYGVIAITQNGKRVMQLDRRVAR